MRKRCLKIGAGGERLVVFISRGTEFLVPDLINVIKLSLIYALLEILNHWQYHCNYSYYT